MRFITLTYIFISTLGISQTKLNLSSIDSAVIEVYQHTSKEMVTANNEAGWVLLAQKKIKKRLVSKIEDFLQDPDNFSENRALLTHDNVQIYFYQSGELILAFHLSTLTRNIFIEDGNVHYTWSVTPESCKGLKKFLKKTKVLRLIEKDLRFPSLTFNN